MEESTVDDLEQELRHALQREEVPRGFERRVLERVNRRRPRWMQWGAVAAVAALAAGGAIELDHRRKEREAGEAARAKLELALKVTRAQFERVGRALEQNGN